MLTILCGFPGCGKSTYVAGLQNGAIVICPDDFRVIMTGQNFYAPAEEAVWSAVKTAVRALLLHKYDVIIDETSLTVGQRAQWIGIANEWSSQIKCIWFNVPVEVCRARNTQRDKVVPDDAFNRLVGSFVPPIMDEGFDEIVELSGIRNVQAESPKR
ncbi:MAG: ATP-binding protein [Sulfurimonas sp.]|jgi:predicted kinase